MRRAVLLPVAMRVTLVVSSSVAAVPLVTDGHDVIRGTEDVVHGGSDRDVG